MQMPNIPRLRYDRLGWVVFVVISGIILLGAVAKKKHTPSEETFIEVAPLETGEKLINERDVKNVILKAFGNNLQGIPVGELEMERIENALEADPFVKNADAFVDVHSQIHVRVEQREPILRVMDASGSNYYLDIDGKRIPPSRNYAAHVLVATGNLPPFSPDFLLKKKSPLKDLFELNQVIAKDEFLSKMIQQIHLTEAGDFVLVPTIGDQKIVVGGIKNLDNKFWRLKTFYKEAMTREGFNKYETINLKYRDQVVCRK
jgi:cell division protein FtsQ